MFDRERGKKLIMFCYVVNVINVIDFVKGLNCFLFINRKVKLFVFYL